MLFPGILSGKTTATQPLDNTANSDRGAEAFQAYDEGSIPFTRSNLFNDLAHGHRAILTSVLLLILTNVRGLFA